ncbi:sialate O-acetylesterase [Henriciella sp.]|uniref:sialate O-acetylesterase n=1 Tax=Henriciella sp. TaxID=1968823 RepID=UPI00261EA797|nr:sialate O-acetylesterase [Henriciella sp.]
MKKAAWTLAALAFLGGCQAAGAGPSTAQLVVDGAYADHAVVQRGANVEITGEAGPGAVITASLAGQTVETQAGSDGGWSVSFAPLKAGGPYDLSVSDGTTTYTAEDILVGDVLLCSGQSNMEYPVYRALNPDSAISESADEGLRLLTVPQETALSPQSQLLAGASWAPASPENVRDFSAVCYFIGERLRTERGVPIGLIDSSWGGSQIEAWLPQARLQAAGGFDESLATLDLYREEPVAAMKAYGAVWESWWKDEHESAPWKAELDLSTWKRAPEEFGDWKAYGDAEIENHLGRLWFSRRFELTEEQATGPATISLGLFDDSDAVWINGEFIGSTSSWTDQRVYTVDPGVLKAGQNTILINVLNNYGPGGMMGPGEVMRLEPQSGKPVPLGSGWSYKAVMQPDDGGPRPPWESVTGYTTIGNAMIAPLHGTAVSAAIWYQGESNTGRADAYEGLLGQLIAGWRSNFGADLPVVVVQLPGYGAMPELPSESGWAGVQDAQRRVALADPLTGLVTTMDVGHRTDIHPPDKLTVAMRAVDVLDGLSGASDASTTGYSPVTAERDGGSIRIDLPEGDYTSISGDRVVSVSVCDEAGRCNWADARLDGRTLVATVPEGFEPATIRHCWGDAPICNLYADDMIPVTPFKLDVR